MKKQHNPGTDMKCRFSNQVHRILEPLIEVKASERWKSEHRDKHKFTDEQKLKMFEEIWKLHREISNEYVSFRYNKKKKRKIQEARVERGYVRKKTPKA